ncbi:MAG: hypothetical protein K0R57_131 [Paenibacillaceae bacterium]|jgi:transcriptional regulator with PAS, ATPase and Fis domain|nr:hypothetical protein [Paenibacillaceae bacterium]
MELKEIQPTIQQIVVAISAVLQIEVEIADHELFRIAGTGVIKYDIWKDMRNEDFVYRQCLKSGQPVIVERPGFEELCAPCMHYQNCKEFGEVCYPILLQGKVLGVIGLIALNGEQRDRLFSDVEAKIDFLHKMSEMIASKIKESELLLEQQVIERKLSALIGYIDNGVLMINHSGQCEFINRAARELLRIPEDQLPGREIIGQLVEPFCGRRSVEESEAEGKLIAVKLEDKYTHLFVTYHPSRSDEYVKDAVIMIADPEHMADVAMKYTEGSHKGFEVIIGNHPLIQTLKDTLRKIANSRSPVLIRGESGTGKEFIAECIHRYSERKNQPYTALNCAVLPEPVLDKQLFGGRDRKGKLVETDGGTLFLDDIADMPMSIQLKLLRVLEEKSVWLEEGREQVPIDVRMICSTDKDLERLIQKGSFRRDLFYKLSIFPLEVPSLSERRQDILLLANHFLQVHSRANRKYITSIREDVKKILVSYHWPGNIRELSNIMEYAVNFSDSTSIHKEHLPEHIRNIEVISAGVEAGIDQESYNLKRLEREMIQRALAAAAQNGEPKERAAVMLGIGRATLFRKMQQYELI